MFARDLEAGMVLDNEYIFIKIDEEEPEYMVLVDLNDPYFSPVSRTFDDEDDFEVRKVTSDDLDYVLEKVNDELKYKLDFIALLGKFYGRT